MPTKPRRPGALPRPAADLPPLGKQLRKLRGTLTMAEAAAKCDATPQWWSRKETGDREISAADLQSLAKAFGVAWHIDGKSSSFAPTEKAETSL